MVGGSSCREGQVFEVSPSNLLFRITRPKDVGLRRLVPSYHEGRFLDDFDIRGIVRAIELERAQQR